MTTPHRNSVRAAIVTGSIAAVAAAYLITEGFDALFGSPTQVMIGERADGDADRARLPARSTVDPIPLSILDLASVSPAPTGTVGGAPGPVFGAPSGASTGAGGTDAPDPDDAGESDGGTDSGEPGGDGDAEGSDGDGDAGESDGSEDGEPEDD